MGPELSSPRDTSKLLQELNKLDDRTRTIFRSIVDTYLSTGEPVGSRNLSRALPMSLSPASVRNIMSDLERLGLIVVAEDGQRRPVRMSHPLYAELVLARVGRIRELAVHRQLADELATLGTRRRGDLLALAEVDGETELRSVTSAVMATTEADAERGARIWDPLVSLERSALKDAQLRRRAAEFKQDFVRRSAVDPRRTEVHQAWEEWKTRHGPQQRSS